MKVISLIRRRPWVAYIILRRRESIEQRLGLHVWRSAWRAGWQWYGALYLLWLVVGLWVYKLGRRGGEQEQYRHGGPNALA